MNTFENNRCWNEEHISRGRNAMSELAKRIIKLFHWQHSLVVLRRHSARSLWKILNKMPAGVQSRVYIVYPCSFLAPKHFQASVHLRAPHATSLGLESEPTNHSRTLRGLWRWSYAFLNPFKLRFFTVRMDLWTMATISDVVSLWVPLANNIESARTSSNKNTGYGWFEKEAGGYSMAETIC